MSRIAKMPIDLPSGVEAVISGQNINIKGSKGSFDYQINSDVLITKEENSLVVKPKNENNKKHWAMAGTMRAITDNMVVGVRDELSYTGNADAAAAIGKLVAERAKEKGIESVAFDRSGFKYHGRVKALAEAAREAGLQF